MITHAMRKEIKHVSGQLDEVSRRQRAQEERINQFTPDTSKFIYMYTLLKPLNKICKQNTYLKKKFSTAWAHSCSRRFSC